MSHGVGVARWASLTTTSSGPLGTDTDLGAGSDCGGGAGGVAARRSIRQPGGKLTGISTAPAQSTLRMPVLDRDMAIGIPRTALFCQPARFEFFGNLLG
jgi:hypothetical protein